MVVRHDNRLDGGRSIPVPNDHSGEDYLLIDFGVLATRRPRGTAGASRQAPYNFKDSYGGSFVRRLHILRMY
jgi:hypothetical protein